MIAINEQLGFTIIGVSRHWELDLARVRTMIPAAPASPTVGP
jgi:hypothetical protein